MQFLDIHAMTAYLSWTLFVQIHQIMTAQSHSIEADFNYSISTKIDTLNVYTVNKYAAFANTITLEQLKNASFHDKNYQDLVH